MLDSQSNTAVPQGLVDYFRCPAQSLDFDLLVQLSVARGFFRFGSDVVCYGRSCTGLPSRTFCSGLHDVLHQVQAKGAKYLLPFDPSEAIDNLRLERYLPAGGLNAQVGSRRGLARRTYYFLRPVLGTSVRKHMHRFWPRGWEKRPFPTWLVDRTVDKIYEQLLLQALKAQGRDRVPFIWFWPDGKSACVLMTHDVETVAGLEHCPRLMDLDDSYGFKASFQLVPEGRYRLSDGIFAEIRQRGFEINVHDWNHDGFLFDNWNTFLARAQKINQFPAERGAKGFRSSALYRKVEWYGALKVDYDMSVPSVGHLDPQPGGCCTVMPYFIGDILELPITATQDYSLFHVLNDYSLNLWTRQAQLIREGNGLANFIVHPDYIIEGRARASYSQLLAYLSRRRSEQNVWTPLPAEVNRWWRERSRMKLVEKSGGWCVEGPGKDRARIAYAVSDGHRLVYTLD